MRPFVGMLADIWALNFGRADRWWAWVVMMGTALTIYRVSLIGLSQPMVGWFILDAAFLVVGSAIGIALRRWKGAHRFRRTIAP